MELECPSVSGASPCCSFDEVHAWKNLAMQMQLPRTQQQQQLRDHPPEEFFQFIVDSLSHLCDIPIAVIQFREGDQMVVKAATSGVSIAARLSEPYCDSPCQVTVEQKSLFELEDMSAESRFASLPTVSGSPNLRFYAGVPLLDPTSSEVIGTLCIKDTQPRRLIAEQRWMLRTMAKQVVFALHQRQVDAIPTTQPMSDLKTLCDRVLRSPTEQALSTGSNADFNHDTTPSSVFDEHQRLIALAGYKIDHHKRETGYDALTQLAADICGAPIALISLVHSHETFFKSAVGMPAPNGPPRQSSFCSHAIRQPNQVFIVEDTLLDPRFRDNPLVTGAPHLRSYVGSPLVDTATGQAIGAICVADLQPRSLTPLQQHSLQRLGQLSMALFERQRRQNTLEALQDQLKKAYVVAEQARLDAIEAAQAKSQFLNAMSHEVRTPMNAILGICRLLADTNLSMEQQLYISMISNSGELLLTIINDVLYFGKLEAGQILIDLKSHNVADVIESALMLMHESAHQKGLALTWDIDTQIPPALLLDANRLQQVLLNLISNAIKFTKVGSVVVQVSGKWLTSASTQQLSLSESRQFHLQVSVRDTGIGISAADLKKLFVSFGQVQSSSGEHGGSGLGLVISERLLQAMGGSRLVVSSEVGHGSELSFEIACSVPTDEISRSADLFQADQLTRDGEQCALAHASVHYFGRSSHWPRVLNTVAVDLVSTYGTDFESVSQLFPHISQAASTRCSNSPPPILIVLDADESTIPFYLVLSQLDHELNRLDEELKAPPLRVLILHTALFVGQAAIDTLSLSPRLVRCIEYLRKPFRSRELLRRAADLCLVKAGQEDDISASMSLQKSNERRPSSNSSSLLPSPSSDRGLALVTLSHNNNKNIAGANPDSVQPASSSTPQAIRRIQPIAAKFPLRILLAEDNAVNQKMMVMLLRRLGYEILVGANGIEALQLLDREARRGREFEIECILMDASMDGMDGFECTRLIRAQQMPHRIRPFIIAQTANVTDDCRRLCNTSGMDYFLPKPIQLDKLVECLQIAFRDQHSNLDHESESDAAETSSCKKF